MGTRRRDLLKQAYREWGANGPRDVARPAGLLDNTSRPAPDDRASGHLCRFLSGAFVFGPSCRAAQLGIRSAPARFITGEVPVIVMLEKVKLLAAFLFGTTEPPIKFEAPEHVHLMRGRRNAGSDYNER